MADDDAQPSTTRDAGAEGPAPEASDASSGSSEDAGTAAAEATPPADDSSDDAGSDPGGGFDVDAAEARLQEVEREIEEGRRALADVEQEIEPEPEGQPIAEGEGAQNAPPG